MLNNILIGMITVPTIGTLIQSVSFSSTAVRGQRPDHRLYGRVDWAQVEGGKYAVVDPLDPSNILYLSSREYLTAQKTWISNDVSVVILATPSDRPKTPGAGDTEPKNSPRKLVPGFDGDGQKASKARIWGMFTTPLKRFINVTLKSKRAPDATGVYQLLPQPVVEVNSGNIYDLILEWGLLLHYRLFGLASGRGFRKALIGFAVHALAIFKAQGGLNLTKRLKIYALVLKAYVGDNPYKSTHELGMRVRLSKGLPKHLPASVRSILRSKHVQHIRFWISLLHAYKAMVVRKPFPNIADIVATHPDLTGSVWEGFQIFQERFVTMFKPLLRTGTEPDFSSPALHWAPTSGPNVRPAFQGILDDLLSWALVTAHKFGWAIEYRSLSSPHPFLRDVLARWALFVSEEGGLALSQLRRDVPLTRFLEDFVYHRDSKFHKMVRDSTKDLRQVLDVDDVWVSHLDGPLLKKGGSELAPPAPRTEYAPNHPLGDWVRPDRTGIAPCLRLPSEERFGPVQAKIVFLNEPAGKVRNVAVFDWWSQQFLKPVHDWLFKLLAVLPTDSTFDQEGAIRKFAAGLRSEELFSYDLKAATEMIPQKLYEVVLTELWGRFSARAWMSLLCDRWFHFSFIGKPEQGKPVGPIRYRRGQPMGALSSWASMALVHHSVLQFAASRVGKFPFWNYRILGDDIVIAGRPVADSYLQVCKELCIPISVAKSLCSKNGFFDFASQIMRWKVNYSPISLREELASLRPGRRIEFALRQVRRGIIDPNSPGWFSQLLKFVVPKSVYTDIQEARQSGKLDPAAKVVMMELLGTLELKLSRLGLPLPTASCWTYFLGLTNTKLAFRESFMSFLSVGKPAVIAASKDLALEVLAYKAKFVYAKFLKVREFTNRIRGLAGGKRALSLAEIRTLLPGKEYLSVPLFHLWSLADKANYITEWETKYRRLVKTVDVATRLRPMSLELFEFTLEKSLQRCWDDVALADQALLVSPESLLGEGVLPDEIDILNPADDELNQLWSELRRIGGWTGLLEVARSDRSVTLGLPGPITGPELSHSDPVIKQGTTPSGRLSRIG